MIVSTMSLPEVYNEVIRDFDSVERCGKAVSRTLESEMNRLHQVKTTRIINHITKAKNKWCIQVKSNRIEKQHVVSYFIRCYDNHGLIAFNLFSDGESKSLAKYSTHFFKRYNERMTLHETNMERLVRTYFKNNTISDFKMGEINGFQDGTKQVYIPGKEGVALGWFDEEKKLICIKTFVRNDMLKGTQVEFVNILKGYSNEVLENIKFDPAHLTESKEKFI